MRELDHGGVGAARNPVGAGDSDGRAMFSRAATSRMMAESRAALEATDRAVELITHADVSKPHRPDSSQSSSSSSDQPRTCTVWAGSLPPTSEADYSFATSGRDLNAAASSVPSAAGPPVSTASLKSNDRPRDPSLSAVGGAGNGAAVPGERISTAPPRESLGALAADGHWDVVFSRLVQEGKSTFVTGGPGVGKPTFLRGSREALHLKWPAYGEVVVVAPAGTSAKTANGQTYHSFFGFSRDYEVQRKSPVEEAARLLKMERFRGVSRRLAFVRVLLLDEVSMVAADKFDVMHELLRQSRSAGSPLCIIHSFGDFLQLGPLACGSLAFTAQSWRELYGDKMLQLSRVHRQSDPAFVRAINDARYGNCSPAVVALMNDCAVTDAQYEKLRCSVLHLLPRHENVERHNSECLSKFCGANPPKVFVAVDSVQKDKDRDPDLPLVDPSRVTVYSRNAALVDCVAPSRVPHCVGARVMLTSNLYLALGLYHGSIGAVALYKTDGTPIFRFESHTMRPGTGRGLHGGHDAGADWLEFESPVVSFEVCIMACPGAVAVRRQVPFALGWGITVHRSQSLSLSEAVLDTGQAFGPGMVNAAISRVGNRMYVKSFTGSRLYANRDALAYYRYGVRL